MVHLYFLHGFLGLPSDWEFVIPHFTSHNTRGTRYVLHFPHLFDQFQPSRGFHHFSKQFNRLINPKAINILIGYSLGGRLALHAFLDQPNLWNRAAFISTHPGLPTQIEKKKRLLNDAAWATDFLTEEWNSLMKRWNQQSVFNDSSQFERKEGLFNRKVLSDTLKHWSLGKQQDFRQPLSQVPNPVQWINGKNDQKFLKLSATLKFKHPSSQFVMMEQAGHRAPWDQQKKFIQSLTQFINPTYDL